MKWFGTKAAREAWRPFFMRPGSGFWSGGGAAPGEWPASYEGQVRASVVGNPVAQRAVRLVTETAQGAPLAGDGAAGDVAAALALVGAVSGGQGLVETLALHLLLHGNGYVQIIAGADGAPAALFALRPERVSVEADARGWPVAYRYRVGEHVTRLASEDGAGRTAIVHIRAQHPLDDHYGLGCMGAAAGAVAIHNAATVWNKALLDNAARPSGALLFDPGVEGAVLSSEQYARLKAELEAQFAGTANAGRPLLLEGGLKWQALSLSPADMDFVGLKGAAAREIALAFGVPPMLMGLPGDNSYANYREANKAVWRQTIVPLVDKIAGGIAQGLRPWMPGLTLRVDQDQVGALSEERSALWARVSAADFLSDAEKRAMLGVGVAETA